MTEETDKINDMALSSEIEDTIGQIIIACGPRPLKEKVSLLYLSIDYIFYHHPYLNPNMSDKVSIH